MYPRLSRREVLAGSAGFAVLAANPAIADAKEYFAEATEAYFGTNDFYPFVRPELNEHDPEGYAVVRAMWGVAE